MVSYPKISVVLTAYKRPQYLEEQVAAVLDQTVPPHEIILWYNVPERGPFSIFTKKMSMEFRGAQYVKKIVCDFNFGIFPRFCIVPCLDGEYVCVFDDDTIPGRRWFENCLNHSGKGDFIFGTIGLRVLSLDRGKVETQKPRMGWEACNEALEVVDFVGHSWFFRKDHIRYLWEEPPLTLTFGEDIHFCAMLARHGIRAACPPHPKSDKSLWGSTKPERGIDRVAISAKDHSKEYWAVLNYEIQKGFKPMLL